MLIFCRRQYFVDADILSAPILLTTASFTIKVVYDHTRIASYRHWGARSAGLQRIRLLALDGRSAKLAGGLSSDPILSGNNCNLYKISIECKNWIVCLQSDSSV